MSLAPFPKIQHLSSESPLVYLAIFYPRERHSYIFQIVYRLWCIFRGIVDRVLVSQPVGPFHGVVKMPLPTILLHITFIVILIARIPTY